MIVINIDVMLAKKKMSVTELTEKMGFTMANVSLLKNGKVKAIKLTTLSRLCEILDCQPGDILEYRADEEQVAELPVAENAEMPAAPKIKAQLI